jgi:hypothetical protein
MRAWLAGLGGIGGRIELGPFGLTGRFVAFTPTRSPWASSRSA